MDAGNLLRAVGIIGAVALLLAFGVGSAMLSAQRRHWEASQEEKQREEREHQIFQSGVDQGYRMGQRVGEQTGFQHGHRAGRKEAENEYTRPVPFNFGEKN